MKYFNSFFAGLMGFCLFIGLDIYARPSSFCFSTMTYNIRFDTNLDGRFAWPHRKHLVIKTLEEQNLDIFGLQEVLDHQLKALSLALPQYGYIATGRDDGERKGEMAPIFFRTEKFRPLDHGTFWLSPNPNAPNPPGEEFPWGTQLNRIATWITLEDIISSKVMLFINTHLDHQSPLARKNGLQVIKNFVDTHPQEFTILVGDFNMNIRSDAFSVFLNDSEFLDTMPMSITPPYSNSQKTSLTNWLSLVGTNSQIDHILSHNTAEVLTYRVIDTQYKLKNEWIYPSDHLPVRADLCF